MPKSKKTRKKNNLVQQQTIRQDPDLSLKKNSVKVIWSLIKQTNQTFIDHRNFWLILILIYFIFDFIFVQSLKFGINVTTYNHQFQKVFAGQSDGLLKAGLSSFNSLVFQPLNASANVFYFFLIVILINVSLFALKKFHQGEEISIRQALYHGTSRLIPILILIFFIFLDLLPAIIGVSLFSIVNKFIHDNSLIAQIFWLLVLLGSLFWSFYLLVVNLISLLVVVNHDQLLPRQAVRLAKQLVKNKRLLMILDLIIVLIAIFIIFLAINLLIILAISQISAVVYYISSGLILPYLIVFMDNLYRKLENESLSSQAKN